MFAVQAKFSNRAFEEKIVSNVTFFLVRRLDLCMQIASHVFLIGLLLSYFQT